MWIVPKKGTMSGDASEIDLSNVRSKGLQTKRLTMFAHGKQLDIPDQDHLVVIFLEDRIIADF